MRQVTILFALGITAGTYLFTANPVMTLSAMSIVIFLCAIVLKRENVRIWLLLLLFAFVGTIRSSMEMQKLSDRYDTTKRSSILYYHHVESQENNHFLHDLRQRLGDIYQQIGIKKENIPIIKAMSLGDKSDISKDTRQLYSRTGASHVLALSGMHLAIIYAILSALILKLALLLYFIIDFVWEKSKPRPLLKFLIVHRCSEIRLRHVVTILIITIIWLYVVLVGMSSSVVRSAMMITIYACAKMLFRQSNTLNVLSITALVMLLLSPLSLFDVGFQMSFLAVTGIALLYSPLHIVFHYLAKLLFSPFTKKKPKAFAQKKESYSLPFYLKPIKWIWDCIILSLSAQIAVAPLVAFYFGVISLSSLFTTAFLSLTAMLIVWLSVAVLVFGVMGLVSCSIITAPILDFIASAQNRILEWQVNLPHAYIDNVSMSLPQLILLYIIIGCFTRIIVVVSRNVSSE